MYKDAWIMVAIHNPGTVECTGELYVRPTRGLFAQRVDIPIPRMRPGQTIRFPLVLPRDIEEYNKHETQFADENVSRAHSRWWEFYLDDPPPVRIELRLQGETIATEGDVPKGTRFNTTNDEFVHPVKEPFGKPQRKDRRPGKTLRKGNST